ncbi:hypothetical protein LWI29_017588 [Acer saccharum]|uniref:Uncharacterized protein n=1 Tax=Acer saccharum TaxID=4024 RepID=A0AA39RK48_ACESA|nr:hypothetical protein LWI29_017588 [Acer saccharum]KAK1552782.1 hypothetical protein Q3G72_023479 [Acer saccharum]
MNKGNGSGFSKPEPAKLFLARLISRVGVGDDNSTPVFSFPAPNNQHNRHPLRCRIFIFYFFGKKRNEGPHKSNRT